MLADIVVFDGLDELDALGPYEILRRAGQLSIDFSVRLVTHTGQRSVCAASGLTFETDGTFIPGEAEIGHRRRWRLERPLETGSVGGVPKG